MTLLLWTLGCGPSDTTDPARPPSIVVEDEPVVVAPEHHAVRASIALRGIRPSVAELDAVRADPAAIEALVDTWLADPRFGDTVVRVHEGIWNVWSDFAPIPVNGSLATFEAQRIKTALYESPLRLVERIVTEDRPYTEIVTADWTMANEVTMEALLGLGGYPEGGTGWHEVRWTDGRPHAGLLSDSVLWFVYRSAGTNYSRGRAALLTRALVCRDFYLGDQDVETAIDLADVAVVTAAVQEIPGCAACHRDLDPIASSLPFLEGVMVRKVEWPIQVYDETLIEGWKTRNERAPAWFGEPVDGLAGLGRAIAADPDFASCTARRLAGWLTQREPMVVPNDEAEALAEVLVSSGWSYRALAREIVLSKPFTTPPAAEDGLELRVRSEELSQILEDLTGFRWIADPSEPCCDSPQGEGPLGEIDLLTDARHGYRVVSGGIDAPFPERPFHAVSPPVMLVARSAAARAAEHAVASGALVNPAISDPVAVSEAIVGLHLRLYGERVDAADPSVEATVALFEEVAARSDPARAWTVVLAAMLQDGRMLLY